MGYREGLFDGKSQAMQPGFDAGFSLHSRLKILLDLGDVIIHSLKDINLVIASRLTMSMMLVREDTSVYSAEDVARISPTLSDLIQTIALYIESDQIIETKQFPAGANGERIFPVIADFYTCLCDSIVYITRK